ncbi:hypothetical protein L915_11636, partial [Phytophthora nicotianae]
MEMHTSLMESLATTTTNRVTKAPPGEKDYVTRKTTNVPANGVLFGYTETGNPIDLRQNFMREANARLEAR